MCHVKPLKCVITLDSNNIYFGLGALNPINYHDFMTAEVCRVVL